MITIKKLTPGLVDEWLGFFDGIAFGDHGEWASCYCLEGHMTRQANETLKDPEARREQAKQLILNEKMQGYLAFDGERVCGWCNANDRDQYPYLSELFDYGEYEPDARRTKSIFCFLVASEYRRCGIAGMFLDRVCEDARREGFPRVEAYPFSDERLQFQFHGTKKMYLKNGFSEIASFQFMDVVEKVLR